MPRIAATLGVFGLVVLALGLNMAQFPIECIAVAPPPEHEVAEGGAPPSEPVETGPIAGKPTREAPNREEPRASRPGESTSSAGAERKAEEDSIGTSEPSDPPPPTSREAQPDSARQYAGAAGESEASTAEDAGPTTEARNPLGVGTAHGGAQSRGQSRKPFTGGIYNPLEPHSGPDPDRPTFARAVPEAHATAFVPAEAVAGPPYGTAGSPPITAGRAMVPIDSGTEKESGTTLAADQVVRLPPVDNAWPGVPADHPLDLGSPSLDTHYPTTEATCGSCDSTADPGNAR